MEFYVLEIKKNIFIILCLLFSTNILCQEAEHNRRVNAERNPVPMYYFGGLFFNPLNESSNVPDSVLCNTYEEEFYLNGLKIGKGFFITLQLSSQHLSNDSTTFFNRSSSKSGYGIYEYHYDQENDCANKIIFRVDTKLPIFLNGIALDESEQKDRLSEVKPDNIIAIIRKSCFFRKGKIEIITK
jgi:hypothetical protein